MSSLKPKIFITGGTGFLGSQVINYLLLLGYSITALARSPEAAEKLKTLGCQVVAGDLENIYAWAAHLKDSNIVIHCAAPVEFWGPMQKFHREITLATKNLAEACDQQNINRFIYISSESVMQDRSSLLDINESYPYPAEPNSYYGKAKKSAELALLNMKTKMKILILRPPFIWGKDSLPLKNILNLAKEGKFAWINQGNTPFEAVHVENIAHAISLLLFQGKDKEIYFVTDNQRYTIKNFFTPFFQAHGIHHRIKNFPAWPLWYVALVFEKIWRLFNISSPPPLSLFELSFLAMPRRYDISKIMLDTSYIPKVFFEGDL